jgi:Spy/CpxP family protein refolding chaperone
MLKRLAALIIITTLCSAVAPGRGERVQESSYQGFLATPQMDEQSTIIIMTAILELTDAQQQQLRANFDDAVKTATPIVAQMQATKTALFEAAKSANNEDQIQKLGAQVGTQSSQLAILQAHTFAKLWAMLTDQQKSQVDSTMYEEIGEFLSRAGQAAPATTPTGATPGTPQR